MQENFSLLFIQNMGPGGIILIVLVVLLLFGGKKIPELMKGLGQGMKEFKDASNGKEGKDGKATSDKIED
jgi:sec-independent protein translocase protein TatA